MSGLWIVSLSILPGIILSLSYILGYNSTERAAGLIGDRLPIEEIRNIDEDALCRFHGAVLMSRAIFIIACGIGFHWGIPWVFILGFVGFVAGLIAYPKFFNKYIIHGNLFRAK